jgi:hypothetical protein
MKLNYDFGRPMLVEQQVRRERTCRTSLFRKLRKPRKDEFRAANSTLTSIRGIFETRKKRVSSCELLFWVFARLS